MYEVILNDSDARKFPLAVGEINDVTTELHNEIRNHTVAIQLLSLRSNPGRHCFEHSIEFFLRV